MHDRHGFACGARAWPLTENPRRGHAAHLRGRLERGFLPGEDAEAFARYLGVKSEVKQLLDWDLQFQNSSGVVVKEAAYEARVLADGSCDVLPNDLHIVDWREIGKDADGALTTVRAKSSLLTAICNR